MYTYKMSFRVNDTTITHINVNTIKPLTAKEAIKQAKTELERNGYTVNELVHFKEI